MFNSKINDVHKISLHRPVIQIFICEYFCKEALL